MSIATPESPTDFSSEEKEALLPPSETLSNDDSGRERDVNLEHCHMQELEVDLGPAAVPDEKIEDYEGDESPFPEVRAVVPAVDDPAIPVNTLRMWVLGFVFTMLGAGINQFFSLRYPSVHIVSLVAELLAYPCGVFLAKAIPLCTVDLGPLGMWCLNPDRHFNIKEHALITIMSNVSFGFGSADSTKIIQAGVKFYDFDLAPGFSIMVVLCCQLLGFGVAGLSAPLLVEPASIIWPGVLSNVALLSTLHSRLNPVANGWMISRLRFFMYVMVGAAIWYFFPGLMFVGLSYFTWLCWILPNNLVVNHLFGMVTGLGLSPITFDWSQIAYTTNPLLSPSWAGKSMPTLSKIWYLTDLNSCQRLRWLRHFLLDRYACTLLHQYLVHILSSTVHSRAIRQYRFGIQCLTCHEC
jgi:hypothetical protein